jgi:hypothetical protein
MNKEVSVTGMEVKAHAEEGLLINEVAAFNDTNWDDQATAGNNVIALRPASTSNLTNWWHANSKVSNEEAGIGDLSITVDDGSGNYYSNVSASNTPTISDKAIVGAVDSGEAKEATGATQAETHVYYKDASFGTASQYDDGEGYYVKYTYYLKSSGDRGLAITDLQAAVRAAQKAEDTGNTANLMKSLRVGIEVPTSASSATRAGFGIFAPVNGADASYSVTNVATGATSDSVTAVVAGTTGQFTALTTLNISSGTPATPATITIPDANSAGIPVYVYVWFEGEDGSCTSDNLQTILSTYDIDVKFSIGDAVY